MNLAKLLFFSALLSAIVGAALAAVVWGALMLVPIAPVPYAAICGVAWSIVAVIHVVRYAWEGPFLVERDRYGSITITRPFS